MTRTGTGRYRVRMPGLGSGPGVAHAELSAGWGHPQATSCQVAGTSRASVDQIIDIACFDPAGAAKNLPFLVIYVGAGNGPTPMVAARYDGAGNVSTAGHAVDVARTGVGRYTIDTDGAFDGRGFPRFTPVGTGLRIQVECDAPGGAALDTGWTLSYPVPSLRAGDMIWIGN